MDKPLGHFYVHLDVRRRYQGARRWVTSCSETGIPLGQERLGFVR